MLRFCLIGLALAGCTQFPELDRTITPEVEAADYPALIPLEPVLAGTTIAPDRGADTEEAVQARAAALRARADRLRGGVVDGETQARMKRGVPRG
jgi:hypothetical protein